MLTIYSDGFIYYIPNDEKGRGAVKLELSTDGNSIKEVWSNPKIRNNFHGYVLLRNKLVTTIGGNWLKALSNEDGHVTDSLKIATGSVIVADNKLICYGTNGDVNLVKYGQDGLKVAGNFKVRKGTRHHFSHPVVADGNLYIRHGDALLAYNLK